MAGLANLDPNTVGERSGQAELRAKNPQYDRVAAADQFDAATDTHPQHLEPLHLLVVGFNAPHDGADARRQFVQASQGFGGMVIYCHCLCKINFPVALSNHPRMLVDVVFSETWEVFRRVSSCGRNRFVPMENRFLLAAKARIIKNSPVPRTIYFDYNATTPLDLAVRDAMLPFLGEVWGNPSSVHHIGRQARALLDDARDRVAQFLGAKPSEIIFTSGGTEANNLAIFGAARLLKPKGRHLITSAIEHHAVLHCFDYLEKNEGFVVTRLPVDSAGRVSPDDLAKAMRPDTVLVSVMAANNEIGTIQPVARLGALCRERGIVFHTDAVQWFGKEPFENIDRFNADLVCVCGHKFHGPKGAGLLFARSSLHLHPVMFGGGHENERRAGTENLAAVIGLVDALERFVKPPVFSSVKLKELVSKLASSIEKVGGCEIVSPRELGLANTIAFVVRGADSIGLLAGLDVEGICASSGSACSAGSLEPSHVIVATGRTSSANSLVRFSVGRDSSATEVDFVNSVLPEVVRRAQLGK
jgi:cysteine desulfurase